MRLDARAGNCRVQVISNFCNIQAAAEAAIINMYCRKIQCRGHTLPLSFAKFLQHHFSAPFAREQHGPERRSHAGQPVGGGNRHADNNQAVHQFTGVLHDEVF